MMIDPVTIRQLSDIRVKELLNQAEQSRKLKAIASSEPGLVEIVVDRVSGWLRPARPAFSATIEAKRVTAEIPSL
jgi:hypothetical protein